MNLVHRLSSLKKSIATFPSEPGIYQMINHNGDVIYIGKAINLKARVNSYTIIKNLSIRLQRMVNEIDHIDFIVTNSEVEAFLLEANLIRSKQPKYNIRLKDDKFFSHIILSDHLYPRIYKTRNIAPDNVKNAQVFGPFISANYVESYIKTVQKIFKIRNCTDHYFKTRKRPCLQYHIKRCSAPCVSFVTSDNYNDSIKNAKLFLQGKSEKVKNILITRMHKESAQQNYEAAAKMRDMINAIAYTQTKQNINTSDIKEADFFAFARIGEKICIRGVFYKDYRNYVSHNFVFSDIALQDDIEVFNSFILQFYMSTKVTKDIYLNIDMPESLGDALQKYSNVKVSIKCPKQGKKKRIIDNAYKNANIHLDNDISDIEILQNLAQLLNIKQIKRIDVFDNSHIQGSDAVSAMIVAGEQGFEKKSYRKYSVKSTNIKHNDDYAVMREALERRIQHDTLPDLFLIDGGKGQHSAVTAVLEQHNVQVPVLSIAKGKERFAGNEVFFTRDKPHGFKIADRKLLYYLQSLRDEAHRFAITFHRAKRNKRQLKSVFDSIPGVGKVRKQKILEYFGSVIALKAASIYDIQQVRGVSKKLAHVIYNYIHEQ